ncbi:MAG: hypothetical protein WBM44_23385 [Waterburya sp.]
MSNGTMGKTILYPTTNRIEDFTPIRVQANGACSGVSKSGSCEPRIAKPKGKGSAVPKIKDVPDNAIAQ